MQVELGSAVPLWFKSYAFYRSSRRGIRRCFLRFEFGFFFRISNHETKKTVFFCCRYSSGTKPKLGKRVGDILQFSNPRRFATHARDFGWLGIVVFYAFPPRASFNVDFLALAGSIGFCRFFFWKNEGFGERTNDPKNIVRAVNSARDKLRVFSAFFFNLACTVIVRPSGHYRMTFSTDCLNVKSIKLSGTVRIDQSVQIYTIFRQKDNARTPFRLPTSSEYKCKFFNHLRPTLFNSLILKNLIVYIWWALKRVLMVN